MDDGVAQKGADFGPGADTVADQDRDDLVCLDFVSQGREGFLSPGVVGCDQTEVTLIPDGGDVQRPEVDARIGQSSENPAVNPGLIGGRDMEFGFHIDGLQGTLSFFLLHVS